MIQHLAATADGGVVAWCGFAEGGAGALGIGPDGRKRWGDGRGAACAACGGRFAYSIPNDWNAMGTHLLRLDAVTGAPAPFVRDGAERCMVCPRCANRIYPRINPAVITCVTRGDEILLARRKAPPNHFFSVIAGFVEVGESLEHAVRREVREEVGIGVRDLR